MWKLIFWAIVIGLIIQVIKRNLSAKANRASENQKAAEAGIENMVECDQCHVHLPRSEAFLVEGKFYCSRAHIKSDV
ncbi:PP0621 family protein [Methylotenera sp.]|uniref:PP0621 family protein n=1 Tax=Methylotenera sp. TaxID=2051956 RepID=UPI002ED9885D